MILKNVASQKQAVFAYTGTTGAPKTGDAAQITCYLSKDWGAPAAVTDTNPAELDSTNMPGWYVFDLAQAETNAEVLIFAPKSSTADVFLDQVQVFTQDATISSRAATGAAMTLADDAIKAGTFDESTAFPLKSADTGPTSVARTGADSDTLKTLSDQIDGGGTSGSAADVWSYGTRTLTHPQTSLIGKPNVNTLECIIATTFTVTWSGLNIGATWTAIEFTAKKLLDGADTTALLQVLISNPGDGGDGLQRYMGLSGAAYKAKAALTVDQPNGAVALLVEDDVTALLTKQKVYYDLKLMLADGSSSILVDGTLDAVYTPTMTINL